MMTTGYPLLPIYGDKTVGCLVSGFGTLNARMSKDGAEILENLKISQEMHRFYQSYQKQFFLTRFNSAPHTFLFFATL